MRKPRHAISKRHLHRLPRPPAKAYQLVQAAECRLHKPGVGSRKAGLENHQQLQATRGASLLSLPTIIRTIARRTQQMRQGKVRGPSTAAHFQRKRIAEHVTCWLTSKLNGTCLPSSPDLSCSAGGNTARHALLANCTLCLAGAGPTSWTSTTLKVGG